MTTNNPDPYRTPATEVPTKGFWKPLLLWGAVATAVGALGVGLWRGQEQAAEIKEHVEDFGIYRAPPPDDYEFLTADEEVVAAYEQELAKP